MSVASSQAAGSTKELESAVYNAIPWDEDSPSLNQRRDMARAILAYWTDFSARVPRPSPAEVEWIKTELSSQGDRLVRAVSSPEYAIYQLSQHADMCIADVNRVLDDQSTPSMLQFEMLHWVKLLNCYSNSDLALYLRTAGLSDGTYNGAFALVGTGLVHDKIVNAVIPMAMIETMGWSYSEP